MGNTSFSALEIYCVRPLLQIPPWISRRSLLRTTWSIVLRVVGRVRGFLAPRRRCDLVGQRTLPSTSDRMTQRKLYGEEGCPGIGTNVTLGIPSEICQVRPDIASSLPRLPPLTKGVQTKRSRSSSMYIAEATTPEVPLLSIHRRRYLNVPKRQRSSLSGESRLEGSRCLWDAAEERSLEKQRWDIIRERSAICTEYSRGPEILKAYEKLKSMSQ